MAIKIGDVRPGKCFLTVGAKPQVLRVRSVRSGVVSFEARGVRGKRTEWPTKGEAPVEEFVSGAEREVGSDYALGTTGRPF